MTIGERIKAIREKNHLEQNEFARILGKDQTKISHMEHDRTITIKDVITICEKFNVSTDYLLRGIENENRPIDERFAYLTGDESNIIELMLKQAEKRHRSQTTEYDKIANL